MFPRRGAGYVFSAVGHRCRDVLTRRPASANIAALVAENHGVAAAMPYLR